MGEDGGRELCEGGGGPGDGGASGVGAGAEPCVRGVDAGEPGSDGVCKNGGDGEGKRQIG